MNSLRLSGSAWPLTCSALTVVPRMTNMSTPASTTALANSLVRWGLSAPATVTPASRICLSRVVISSALIGSAYISCIRRTAVGPSSSAISASRSRRVVVAGPETLEVEHAEAAVPTERDRGVGRHHGVHGRGHDRELEAVGVDLPGDRDLLGIARTPARDDRDVVEGVGPAPALGTADLDLAHSGSVSTSEAVAGLTPARK